MQCSTVPPIHRVVRPSVVRSQHPLCSAVLTINCQLQCSLQYSILCAVNTACAVCAVYTVCAVWSSLCRGMPGTCKCSLSYPGQWTVDSGQWTINREILGMAEEALVSVDKHSSRLCTFLAKLQKRSRDSLSNTTFQCMWPWEKTLGPHSFIRQNIVIWPSFIPLSVSFRLPQLVYLPG